MVVMIVVAKTVDGLSIHLQTALMKELASKRKPLKADALESCDVAVHDFEVMVVVELQAFGLAVVVVRSNPRLTLFEPSVVTVVVAVEVSVSVAVAVSVSVAVAVFPTVLVVEDVAVPSVRVRRSVGASKLFNAVLATEPFAQILEVFLR